jgi:hypothetical protein
MAVALLNLRSDDSEAEIYFKAADVLALRYRDIYQRMSFWVCLTRLSLISDPFKDEIAAKPMGPPGWRTQPVFPSTFQR